MAKGLVFFGLLLGLTAQGAPRSKAVANPLMPPIENECAQLGCDVRPADKVTVSRAPNSVFEPARRGCCSYHEGVCGCAANKAVCCDGSLSPSCGCD